MRRKQSKPSLNISITRQTSAQQQKARPSAIRPSLFPMDSTVLPPLSDLPENDTSEGQDSIKLRLRTSKVSMMSLADNAALPRDGDPALAVQDSINLSQVNSMMGLLAPKKPSVAGLAREDSMPRMTKGQSSIIMSGAMAKRHNKPLAQKLEKSFESFFFDEVSNLTRPPAVPSMRPSGPSDPSVPFRKDTAKFGGGPYLSLDMMTAAPGATQPETRLKKQRSTHEGDETGRFG